MKVRRMLLGATLAVASLVVFLPAAQSHSTCTANTGGPPARSSGRIYFSGAYSCPNQIHSTIQVTVKAQRRSGPTQAWNTYAQTSDARFNAAVVSDQINTDYNCAKDYRTIVSGSASPGGHSGTQASGVYYSTC